MSQESLQLIRVGLENFKAFNEVNIEFPQKINLIMGENSSGKSSIIKSIIAIKQTLSATNEHEIFAANGDYVELGVYSDYVHSHENKKEIKFIFEFYGDRLDQEITRWWAPDDFDDDYLWTMLDTANTDELNDTYLAEQKNTMSEKIPCKIEIVYDNDYKTSQARLKSIKIDTHIASYGQTCFLIERLQTRSHYYLKAERGLIDWIIDNNDHIDIDKNTLSEQLLRNYLRIEKENRFDFNLIPPSPPYDSRTGYYDFISLSEELFDIFSYAMRIILSSLESKTYYLAPVRSSPLRSYKRSSHSKSVGINGIYSASVLANLQTAASKGSSIEKDKLSRFNTWLNIIFPDTKINARTIDELVKLKLEKNNIKSEDTISDVGFGFSQVLPILIQGALLNPNDLLIIEQPELHLHPNAQFLFAKVLCSMANYGIKLLIETHSEHLLRGIQVEISKHRIDNDIGISHNDFNIIYVNGKTKSIEKIHVNEFGEIISDWPSGFLDAAYNASVEIMKNKNKKVPL